MSIYKSKSRLPFNIQEEDILDLPNVCGVYYMLDADNEPLYIGKSIKIRTRIRSHFSDETIKTDKMRKLVHGIRYEQTGSEIMSEIYESLEIRKFKPLLNKAKRKTRFDSALLISKTNDYPTFMIKHRSKVKRKDEVLQWFSSKNAAKAYISGLVQRFDLCACLCGINSKSSDCTTYKIGNCGGAFLSMEDKATYSERFTDAQIMAGKLFDEKMVILDTGRKPKEKACFFISDNRVSHIGYVSESLDLKDQNKLTSTLNAIDANPEIDRIVYRYFYLNKYVKRIRLPKEAEINIS